MHPDSIVRYDLAQARIADLRRQARRESLARAAARSAQPDPRPNRPRVPGRLRLLAGHRRRATAAIS